MAYMLIQHDVKDYEGWKSVFDSARDMRKKSGEKSYHILHRADEPDSLVLLFQWDKLDNAREFATSTELKEAMHHAGVVGKPEILFLEEVARG
jgi:heme-degrading monooxygenase HmoA